MYSDILAQTRTKFEKDLLLSEVITLEASLFKVSEGKDVFEETLQNEVRGKVAVLIRKEIENGQDRKQYLKGLQNALESMREVKLTLAFEPTQKVLNRIYSWVTEEVGKNIILDIQVDTTIGGGAIVVSQGKYFDYSLANIFQKKQQETKEIIHSLLNKTNG